MIRLASATIVAAALAGGCALDVAPDDRNLESQLVALERDSWKAWQAQDAAFFETFLSDDHVDVGPNGVVSKKAVVSFIGARACKVESYVLDNFTLTRLSETSAALLYHARQTTTCGGVAIPSPVWATSVYVLRNGRWQNTIYQQLPQRPDRR
jgi:hypothetical protein